MIAKSQVPSFQVGLVLPLVLFDCSGNSPAPDSAIEALGRIRSLAGFPYSQLTYVETTIMVNSPNGDLQVDLYQDEEGRKFFIEPSSNTVVEIDARNLLNNLRLCNQRTWQI